MKLIIASDIHGSAFWCRRLCDLIDAETPDKIIAVRGNCEAEVDQMVLPFPCMADFSQLYADGLSFYLTHGHHHNPANLPPLPVDGTAIFLSGHTHIKIDEVHNGVRCLNPGSVSIPKDGSHSCLIYQNGEFIFRILEE